MTIWESCTTESEKTQLAVSLYEMVLGSSHGVTPRIVEYTDLSGKNGERLEYFQGNHPETQEAIWGIGVR